MVTRVDPRQETPLTRPWWERQLALTFCWLLLSSSSKDRALHLPHRLIWFRRTHGASSGTCSKPENLPYQNPPVRGEKALPRPSGPPSPYTHLTQYQSIVPQSLFYHQPGTLTQAGHPPVAGPSWAGDPPSSGHDPTLYEGSSAL